MKGKLWSIGFSLALTAFTLYFTLDTFVLTSTVQENATRMNTALFQSAQPQTEELSIVEENNQNRETPPASEAEDSSERPSESPAPAILESGEAGILLAGGNVLGTYAGENAQITLTEYVENATHLYVADVRLSSAEYLKTAFAQDAYGRNITAKTSEIAAANGAVLAINGDYYGSQERGYVIRNGIVYRETPSFNDVLCVYADGTVEVVSAQDFTALELAERGVWQAFSFGPGLVEDGEITVSETEEVGKAMASNPRTAIGWISENHFVFVVSDGRTDESRGLSLYELAQFTRKLGVTTAYNLDGGGSSTMVFQGELVNNPTTNGRIKERGVSDIVYIG